MMKLLPYYKEEEKHQCSTAISLIENMKTLSKDDAVMFSDYMNSCLIIDEWLSNERDVLTNEPVIPSETWSDGAYIWDSSHIYYVKKYRVRLPSVFVSHVKRQIEIGFESKNLNINDLKTEFEDILQKITDGDESYYDKSY